MPLFHFLDNKVLFLPNRALRSLFPAPLKKGLRARMYIWHCNTYLCKFCFLEIAAKQCKHNDNVLFNMAYFACFSELKFGNFIIFLLFLANTKWRDTLTLTSCQLLVYSGSLCFSFIFSSVVMDWCLICQKASWNVKLRAVASQPLRCWPTPRYLLLTGMRTPAHMNVSCLPEEHSPLQKHISVVHFSHW